MQVLMLVNPVSGHKRGLQAAQEAVKAFEEQGVKVKSMVSEWAGHLVEIGRQQVNETWDAVVAVGGDGTLFEVVNGMLAGNENLPVPLAVIPVGTGNSFSRDLKSKSLSDTIQSVLEGKSRGVDLGFCQCADQSFCFINIAGFGFVADVAHQASFYKRWGALSYVIGVFICISRLSSYDLEFEIDGQSYSRDNLFVEICNSTKTGGDMIMAPEAKIDDGMLDVVLLNKVSRPRLLSALPKIYKGTHVQMPEVETFRASRAVFRPAIPKGLTPDGESIGSTPITISVLPGKIRIFDR
ncbi:MAG TPA: diacylglycerol kinase family lipid kinase [bacterium]|nr:diacylglycerol kinase family lipid kinase [bacterium]HNT65010.1 diacylglycerol kinase family lipid kinase [bacterium]